MSSAEKGHFIMSFSLLSCIFSYSSQLMVSKSILVDRRPHIIGLEFWTNKELLFQEKSSIFDTYQVKAGSFVRRSDLPSATLTCPALFSFQEL